MLMESSGKSLKLLTFDSLHVAFLEIHLQGTEPSTRAFLECKLSQYVHAAPPELFRDVWDPKSQQNYLQARS